MLWENTHHKKPTVTINITRVTTNTRLYQNKNGMPLHLLGASAVAAVVGATQDCVNCGAENDADKQTQDDTKDRAVRFDVSCGDYSRNSLDTPLRSQSIRSIENERPSFSRSNGTVLLNPQLPQSPPGSPTSALHGFVEGDFSSGKIHDLIVDDKCHVMAYSNDHSLFAVGLAKSLELYETTTWSLVHHVEREGMVSALCWIPEASSSASNSLLGVSGLDGTVSLYRVNVDILEVQGPSLLYEFRVDGQVRALDCGFFGKLNPSLVMAVGDKTGSVTLVSFTHDLNPIKTETVMKCQTGILGISLNTTSALLAWSTTGGRVCVHQLSREHTGAIHIETEVWSVQRNGPVRSVVFDGTRRLAFGGYDKKVILVDTQQWVVSHEINLFGTVRVMTFQFSLLGGMTLTSLFG
jgi:hypothetical protein